MATVADALEALERLAPRDLAYPWDKVGLQVGSPSQALRAGVVALDRSLAAVRFAKTNAAQLLIAHHPLIWEPLTGVVPETHVGATVTELIQSGIAFAAAHTNWDAARGGINDTLAERLGLSEVEPFGEGASETALAIGRMGRLRGPLRLEEFVREIDARLVTRSLAWGGSETRIERVAVLGGAADDAWSAAQAAGADALVTGEVKQHVALEASESGFAIVAAGHYATENPGCAALRDRLAEALPDVEWRHFEPEPGSAGRPLG